MVFNLLRNTSLSGNSNNIQLAMLNKTKNDQPMQRNPSAVANRRPKRCHLCKKNFAYEKYQAHFQQCYRFENKKIEQTRKKEEQRKPEDNRARTQNKPINSRNQSNMQANPRNKAESMRKSLNPQLSQTGTKFRIKNTSNLTQKPKTNSNTKPSQVSRTHNQFNKKQVQIKPQRQTQQAIQEKKVQAVHKQQDRKQQKKQMQKQEEQVIQVEETVSPNMSHYNPQPSTPRRSPYPHQMQDDSQEQLIGLQSIHQTESPSQQQQSPTIAQHAQPRRMREQSEPITHPMPSIVSSSRQILFEQQPQAQIQQPYDIQAVINNSNSIIQFIRGMNFMQQDETLSIMVSQLLQLNQIAQQIAQLNLLGRNLAMGNVFAARIHHLQTAIINQIGIALIRGFNDRLGVQFQTLTVNQPELRVGFSEQQIQTLFPQKFNLTQKQCSICLQDMKRSQMVMQLQCKHIFHPSCIKEWLISSKKCPMCRTLQRSQ